MKDKNTKTLLMTEESPKNVLPLPSLVEKTVQNRTGETQRP